MLDDKDNGFLGQDTSFLEKSDIALVDVIRATEDPTVRDRAFAVIQQRYDERLNRYLRRKLPSDWVEPTKQQIWDGFLIYISTHNITTGVPNLLMTIARNKRADEVEKVKREREIEMDEPVEEYANRIKTQDLEDQLEQEEAESLAIQQFRTFYQHTFLDVQLTGCQRVLLELRRFHQYHSKTVGRLLGRGVSTIDSQISYARKWLNDYVKSDEFRMALDLPTLPPLWQTEPVSQDTLVIDRFSKQVLPQFTPDELKTIGLTKRELDRHFDCSLMFPHSFHDDATTLTPPSLLLTRKADRRTLNRIYNRLKRNPDNLPDEFPVEGLIRVDVEDDYFELYVEPMVQIYPDPEYLLSSDQYMLVHNPRMKVPIALATYDDELSEFTGDRRVWRKLYHG